MMRMDIARVMAITNEDSTVEDYLFMADAVIIMLRDRIDALRVAEPNPNHDWGEEWDAYVHANAVNRTIDDVLIVLDADHAPSVDSEREMI